MKTQKEILEDLISTIERNAIDNKATIQNVELWAKSWRDESNTYPECSHTDTEADGYYFCGKCGKIRTV